MGIASGLVTELGLLWPILAIGFVVFAVYYAGKAAAGRAGRHLGVAGVGLVLLVVAVGSWWLGFVSLAAIFGLVGFVLLAFGLTGKTSR